MACAERPIARLSPTHRRSQGYISKSVGGPSQRFTLATRHESQATSEDAIVVADRTPWMPLLGPDSEKGIPFFDLCRNTTLRETLLWGVAEFSPEPAANNPAPVFQHPQECPRNPCAGTTRADWPNQGRNWPIY